MITCTKCGNRVEAVNHKSHGFCLYCPCVAVVQKSITLRGDMPEEWEFDTDLFMEKMFEQGYSQYMKRQPHVPENFPNEIVVPNSELTFIEPQEYPVKPESN